MLALRSLPPRASFRPYSTIAHDAFRYDRNTFATLRGKNFIDLLDFSPTQLASILDVSHCLKKMYKEDGFMGHRPFTGRTMGCVFQKRSTRTRVSAEAGFNMLGGHAIFLGPADIHLGKEESVKDTASVLGRMNDLLLARVYGHNDVVEMAEFAGVPVINALSDLHHPLQAIADYMILQETYSHDLKGLEIAWVGDGNNVLHSLAIMGANMGCNIRIATPSGYEPDNDVISSAMRIGKQTGSTITLTHDPEEACRDADVIATDTWVSMGNEEEYYQRLRDFKGFKVTEELGRVAKPDWKFIHCLPRKQHEVSDEVFYSPKRSVVLGEAENRMWTCMAVTLGLLRGKI